MNLFWSCVNRLTRLQHEDKLYHPNFFSFVVCVCVAFEQLIGLMGLMGLLLLWVSGPSQKLGCFTDQAFDMRFVMFLERTILTWETYQKKSSMILVVLVKQTLNMESIPFNQGQGPFSPRMLYSQINFGLVKKGDVLCIVKFVQFM